MCSISVCTPRPAARGVQRESRQRGKGGWRARRSRARVPEPPVSNRGVQIAKGQPLYKVETLMPSGFWAFEGYVKIGRSCHKGLERSIAL